MAVYLPPVVKTSKRIIPGTRVFDATKVFADYSINPETSANSFSSHYKNTFHATHKKAVYDKTRSAGKLNKPDPTNVHFLFENPRFINEPVCHASSKETKQQQHLWWPSEVPADIKLKPSYSSNSTNRSDFGRIETRPAGLTRFSCVEGKRRAATGIVPVTELPANRIKTEKISYNHQFDSRRERREGGKLHGSFVWDTSDKNVGQKSRRFAKKHFACPDSLIMTQQTPPEQYMMSIESSDSKFEKPFTRQKTVEPVKLQKASLAISANDVTLKSQHNAGEIEHVLDNKNKSAGRKYQRADKDSPPPHLC